MIALDTNILARFLTADDPVQGPRAKRLLEGNDTYWLPITVLLELAWVLQSKGWGRAVLAGKLRELVSVRNMRMQHPEAVYRALDWFAKGMDLADALHVALSAQADEFRTFDERLARKAVALELAPPVTLA